LEEKEKWEGESRFNFQSLLYGVILRVSRNRLYLLPQANGRPHTLPTPFQRTNADTSSPLPNSCPLHICLADIPLYPQQSAEKREFTIGDHSKNNLKRKRRTNMSSADHSRFPLREPAALLFPFKHHVVSIIYLSMQLCILTYFVFRLGPISRKSVFGSVMVGVY
jgi:hypothetical protein